MQIFISYRRTDSDIAGRIADHLLAEFGRDSVFLDVDSIPVGRDFRVVIERSIARSDCLVMVIGPGWNRASDSGEGPESSLQSETDFVRLEVQAALKWNIPIVPVLVGDVQMPTASSLPQDIAEVAYINATAVRSGRNFQHDIEELIAAVHSTSRQTPPPASAPSPAPTAVVEQNVQAPPKPDNGGTSVPDAVISGNVEEPPFPLFGRDLELEQMGRYLVDDGVRLVTVLGFGGAGKTRLATELRVFQQHFPDGVWMVSLAHLSAGASLMSEVAALFNVGADALDSYLTGKRLLLIIDNCEHLLAETTDLIAALLRVTGVSVVATSRELLGIRGEQIMQLDNLPIPDQQASLSELETNAAVELFLQQARSVQPDFALSAENAEAVAEIIRLVAGIPLALELAASRLRLLSAAEIAVRLGQSFKLLKSAARNSSPRHQTLDQAIDWTYQMLDAEEQQLFRKLSVFRGGFTLEAATAVDGADDDMEVLELIGQLTDKSLFQRISDADETRYGCLEPLRQFAMARASEEELAQARTAHATFFAAHVERVAPLLRGADQLRWLTSLRAEDGNINAALAQACEAEMADIACGIASTLTWFWLAERKLTEARGWLEAALAIPRAGASARASALINLAFLRGVDDPHAEGLLGPLHEGIALFESDGFGPGIGQGRLYEGMMFAGFRDFAAAEPIFSQLTPIMREAQFVWGEAMCEWWMGICTTYNAQFDTAREHYGASLAKFEMLGDFFLITWNRLTMGRMELLAGDLNRAQEHFETAMPIMVQVQDRLGIGVIQMSFAAIAQASGDMDSAKQWATKAQRELQFSVGGQGIGWALTNAPVETTTDPQYRAALTRYRLALEKPVEDWIETFLADAAAFVKG